MEFQRPSQCMHSLSYGCLSSTFLFIALSTPPPHPCPLEFTCGDGCACLCVLAPHFWYYRTAVATLPSSWGSKAFEKYGERKKRQTLCGKLACWGASLERLYANACSMWNKMTSLRSGCSCRAMILLGSWRHGGMAPTAEVLQWRDTGF